MFVMGMVSSLWISPTILSSQQQRSMALGTALNPVVETLSCRHASSREVISMSVGRRAGTSLTGSSSTGTHQ